MQRTLLSRTLIACTLLACTRTLYQRAFPVAASVSSSSLLLSTLKHQSTITSSIPITTPTATATMAKTETLPAMEDDLPKIAPGEFRAYNRMAELVNPVSLCI